MHFYFLRWQCFLITIFLKLLIYNGSVANIVLGKLKFRSSPFKGLRFSNTETLVGFEGDALNRVFI